MEGMIMEEREEVMLVRRPARFLTPTFSSSTASFDLPPSAFYSNHYNLSGLNPIHVSFTGWKNPMPRWSEWVDQMTTLHHSTWHRAGIYEPIMASKCHIEQDVNLVIVLGERWNKTTNTFVFPWGEATVTLEDVMILGGYSVLGQSVLSPVESHDNEEFLEIDQSFNTIILCVIVSRTLLYSPSDINNVVNLVGHGLNPMTPKSHDMQFGYDQDLPCDPKGFVLAYENVNFYVSSRSYRGRASERYTKWHNDMMFVRDIAIQGVLKKEKYYLKIIKKASLLIEAKFDSPILHKSLSKKEMDEFLESSGGEEQLISSKKKSVITPVTDTSKKEEVSSDLSDDDNIPIGTLLKKNNSKDTEEVSSDLSDDDNIPIGMLLKKNNSKDTKVATDSDVLLSTTTSSIVDESNKKRAHIAGDEISEGGLKKKPANNEGTKVKGKAKSTTKVQIETVHITDEQEIQANKKEKKFGNAGKWFSPITID